MLYLWLKYIHIISSTILFGTGIGTAAVMFYAYCIKDAYFFKMVTRYVVIADWIFTLPTIIIQPLTGLWLAWLGGYSFKSFWLFGSIIAYLIALFCWLPVVYLQIILRNMAMDTYNNRFYFKLWCGLGCIAFFAFIFIFYLMTFKPA